MIAANVTDLGVTQSSADNIRPCARDDTITGALDLAVHRRCGDDRSTCIGTYFFLLPLRETSRLPTCRSKTGMHPVQLTGANTSRRNQAVCHKPKPDHAQPDTCFGTHRREGNTRNVAPPIYQPRTTKNALGRALVIGALSLTTLAVSIDTANAQAPLHPDWNTAGVSVVTNPAKVSAFASSDGGRALAAAESKIGAPYVWGATGPDSFDCSGLVRWAYAQAGVSIPRTTYDQAVGGAPVSRDDLQPGDVVLYYGGEHVGIYAGGGEVVHAPTSGESVKRAPVDSMPYYLARRY